MQRKWLCFVFSIITITANAQSGENVLREMYNRYAGKWERSFTFTQTTETYRNDTLLRTQTWYEAGILPDRFRIDFGAIDSGNAVIYKGDSAYHFRKGRLARRGKEENDLIFLIGGMYFFPFETVVGKTRAYGYDPAKSFETRWKGRPVYVIGATNAEEKTHQLWIDKEHLYVVRFVKYENGRKQEGIMEDHIATGGGWTETKVSFYINDKLVQKELYHNYRSGAKLDERLFDPAYFGQWHWMR